jgi:glutamyl/glutaminyl-tRNA synthetase
VSPGIFETIEALGRVKTVQRLKKAARVALTGGTVSPGIFETIEALGRVKTVQRLKKAASYIKPTCSGATA